MQRSQRSLLKEMNVVPYIDVMLVLLVIFMITAPLMTQGVEVDLPQTGGQVRPSEAALPIVISVDKQGRYYLNSDEDAHVPLPLETLLTQVAAEYAVDQTAGARARDILVQGDQAVPYREVALLMAQLQKIGIQKIGLLTAPITDA